MHNIKILLNNLFNRLFKNKLISKKTDTEISLDIINKSNPIINSEAKVKPKTFSQNSTTNNLNSNISTNSSNNKANSIINLEQNTTDIKDNLEINTEQIDIIDKSQKESVNIINIDSISNDIQKNTPKINDRVIYTHSQLTIPSEEQKNKEIEIKIQSSNPKNILTNQQNSKLENEYKNLKLDLSILNQTSNPKNISAAKKHLSIWINLLTFKWLFSLEFVIILICLIAGFIVYIVWDLPSYNVLEKYTPQTITRVYSSDGYILSELGLQNRSITNIDNIPKIVKEAFISAEDKTFYSNFGFDFKAIIRAIINNSIRIVDKNRSLMGASTITQQVVKNILLNHDRTLVRKAKEAILTIKLETNLSKDRILEIYLNEIYLGNGSYGVTTAALKYFNKPLNALTLEEAAFLAILPRSPNGYNPKVNYDGAKARRDWVINRMLEDGKITVEQADCAIKLPIVTHKRTDLAINYSGYAAEEARKKVFSIIPSNVVYKEGLMVKTTINNDLQKLAYHSLRNGIEKVDNLRGYRGALGNILEESNEHSTSNTQNIEEDELFVSLLNKYINSKQKLQKSLDNIDDWDVAVVTKVDKNTLNALLDNAEEIYLDIKDHKWAKPNQEIYNLPTPIDVLKNFNHILKKGDIIFVKKENVGKETKWKLKQVPKVNGAMLVMNPNNGYILAMQGGFSFELSQFNRATQALRQPGSAFKTFVYLAALEKGMTPSSLVLDAPYTISTKDNIWKPKNNTNRYAGYVTMRNALEVSRNLASIRIASFAGLEAISDISKRLGIYTNNIDNFSEVIGSKETTLLKMVKAYSILANGGKNIEPVLVNQIFNREGKLVFKNDNRVFKDFNNIPWENQAIPIISDDRQTLIDPRDAYLITNILEGVVSRGIASRARVYGYNIGGKTGTTNDSKDLWFFGFTPEVVVGIYIGEDIPTTLEPAMASTMVVPIFKEFANKAFPLFFDKVPFEIPEGIEMIWIDPTTGKPVSENCPTKLLESFRTDNKPDYNNNYSNLIEEGDSSLYEGIY